MEGNRESIRYGIEGSGDLRSGDSNENNKDTTLQGAEYLTKLRQLLPSVFNEFEPGDLEK